MDEVPVEPEWSGGVRKAAARVRADLGASRRRLQLRLDQGSDQEGPFSQKGIEEALAMVKLMKALGYGSRDREGHGLDAVDLELAAHLTHPDASRSYFRAVIANRRGIPLTQVFSKEGRLKSREEAESLRREHVERLCDALGEEPEAELFLSPDYIPWVRREEGMRRVASRPSTSRPRLPGEPRLATLEDLLERLTEVEI